MEAGRWQEIPAEFFVKKLQLELFASGRLLYGEAYSDKVILQSAPFQLYKVLSISCRSSLTSLQYCSYLCNIHRL